MQSRTKKVVLLTLLAMAAAGGAAVAIVLIFGLYNVAGNRQHLTPVYSMLQFAVKQSVKVRARDITVPNFDERALLQRGALCYQQKCLQCHGGPGIAQQDFAQAMQPLPGPLIDAAHRWSMGEIFWITRNGLKMTGMPPWEHKLSEQDLWAVTLFVHELPKFSPRNFAELMESGSEVSDRCDRQANTATLTGNSERGRRALYAYACVGCHTVAGTVHASPQIGPPLDGMAYRTRIAGILDNTTENIILWLRETQKVKPGTAMPTMGVTEQDANDIAAFLATLR